MTNLEAIKAIVQYPLDDTSFELALLNRDLTGSDAYSKSNLKGLELAKADCLVTIISSPDISESGYDISHSDKEQLKKIASALYRKWGVYDPYGGVIIDATNQW